MLKSEAKAEVLRLYREWSKTNEDTAKRSIGPLIFYGWLKENHPHVASFSTKGDPYQDVAAWIGNDAMLGRDIP